jgi:hypothetical protein
MMACNKGTKLAKKREKFRKEREEEMKQGLYGRSVKGVLWVKAGSTCCSRALGWCRSNTVGYGYWWFKHPTTELCACVDTCSHAEGTVEITTRYQIYRNDDIEVESVPKDTLMQIVQAIHTFQMSQTAALDNLLRDGEAGPQVGLLVSS